MNNNNHAEQCNPNNSAYHSSSGKQVMARIKSDNVQINISIPAGWKTELENLARIYSA